MAIDLHTHSICSDGSDKPEQIVERAASLGLRAVALTDHDTAEGIEAFMKAGKEKGILTIAGVELSCRYMDETFMFSGIISLRESQNGKIGCERFEMNGTIEIKECCTDCTIWDIRLIWPKLRPMPQDRSCLVYILRKHWRLRGM